MACYHDAMRARLCVLALLLASTSARAQDDEDCFSFPVTTLRSDWPRSGQVAVRETVLENGVRAVTAYTLRWQPDGSGVAFVLGFEDFRLLTIDGRDASEPGVKAVADRLAPRLKVLPRMRISFDGELIELLELDQVIAAVAAEMPRNEETAALEEKLRRPETRRALEAAAAERWNAWGAGFSGLETLGPGYEQETDVEIPGTSPGAVVRGVRRFRLRDAFAYAGTYSAHLQMITDYDPKSLKESLLPVIEGPGVAPAPEGLADLECTRRDRIDGVYVVDRLCPYVVTTTTVITIGAREEREEHEYLFDW